MQKTETTKFRLSYNVKSAVISSEVEKSYEISPCASLSRDDKYFLFLRISSLCRVLAVLL